MSYCPSTGVTNAVMMRSGSQDGFTWLEQDLEQLASLADNPFLIPTLVSQHLTEAFCSAVDRNFDRLHQAEFGSGQTGITMIGENGMPMSRGNCEDPNLSVAVLGVAQHALAVEAYIRGQLLTVDLIKNEMLTFPWQQSPSINHDRIKEQNGLLVKQLDFISRTLDIALIRIDHLKHPGHIGILGNETADKKTKRRAKPGLEDHIPNELLTFIYLKRINKRKC